MKDMVVGYIRKQINALFEGLIKTHPINISKNIIERQFGNDLKIIKDNDSNRLIVDVLNFIEFDKLFVLINNLGYFISAIDFLQNGKEKYEKFSKNALYSILKNKEKYDKIELVLEAKFDIEEKVLPEFLYHITEEKNAIKILKIGLVPKSYSKLTYHPERIYLSTSLKNTIIVFNKFVEKNKDSKYVILQINTNLIPETIFYDDPNFKLKGYYTLDNIPPKSIKIIAKT